MANTNGSPHNLRLETTIARLYADQQALSRLTLQIAAHVGIKTLDGVAPDRWLVRQRNLAAHQYLMELETVDHALSAQIGQRLRASGYLHG